MFSAAVHFCKGRYTNAVPYCDCDWLWLKVFHVMRYTSPQFTLLRSITVNVGCATFAAASCQVSSPRMAKDSTWYRRLRWRGSLSRRTWWRGRAVWYVDMLLRSHSAASLTPTLDGRHHPGLRQTTVHRTTGHPGETGWHFSYSTVLGCLTTHCSFILHCTGWPEQRSDLFLNFKDQPWLKCLTSFE